MFQLLAYQVTAGVNDSNVDMVAVADPNFTRRGGSSGAGHFIFTEPYQLLGASHHGASATDLRFNVPSWNAIGRQHVWPVNRSATIQSDPRIMDLRRYPWQIPINEEVALEESGNLGAATEQEFSTLWIAPPSWNGNMPKGQGMFWLRFTATITVIANAWSADVNITMAENIKGGVYSVIGAEAQAAGLIAFRLNFPRAMLYNGRKLLPGDLGTQAIGNQDPRWDPFAWGEWGRFHSFELPQFEALSISGGGTAIEGRLLVVYLGQDMSLLQQAA